MHISSIVLLFCTLAPPVFSHEVGAANLQGKPSALEQCGVFPQAEMRVCLEKKSAESGEALRHAEKQAFSVLSRWNEDVKFIILAKAKLKASSKAYEQYRDAQCSFVSALGGGAIGNALELRRFSCIIDLNLQRARQLDTETAALP